MIPITDIPAVLLARLDRGETLPARWYTDPAITEREIALIFQKSWNYIGPLAELAEPGDYITGEAGKVPIVVVRNDDGLAAFVNVCRHRRHIVMKAAVTRRSCDVHTTHGHTISAAVLRRHRGGGRTRVPAGGICCIKRRP